MSSTNNMQKVQFNLTTDMEICSINEKGKLVRPCSPWMSIQATVKNFPTFNGATAGLVYGKLELNSP